jgi:hypothetical protein
VPRNGTASTALRFETPSPLSSPVKGEDGNL